MQAYSSVENSKGRKRGSHKAPLPLCCLLSPQVESVVGGSPLTYQFYLAAPWGACYGASHDLDRLHPHVTTSMRAQSPIPNLYLTGTLPHFSRAYNPGPPGHPKYSVCRSYCPLQPSTWGWATPAGYGPWS